MNSDTGKPIVTSATQPKKKPGWQPGQSGNPSGKPKCPIPAEIKEQIQQAMVAATPDAVAVLVDIINGKIPGIRGSDRLRGVDILLNRVLGQAVQPIITVDATRAIGMSPAQLADELQRFGIAVSQQDIIDITPEK